MCSSSLVAAKACYMYIALSTITMVGTAMLGYTFVFVRNDGRSNWWSLAGSESNFTAAILSDVWPQSISM